MVASLENKHIVIALCGSEKKHKQSFDKLRVCIDAMNASKGDNEYHGIFYSLVKMRYDEETNKISTETGEDADVVLHKVSTLPPNTANALMRWCAAASRRRRQKCLPPVVMVDPISLTRLVLQRSLVCKLLDGCLTHPLCPMPRSWLWTRQGETLTPLGLSPFVLNKRAYFESLNVDSQSEETWWIVKPDLSTGPAFTHRMVIWKGIQPETTLPEKVQRLLPPEANEFVVQEFLLSAIPVVIKVYCMGTFVFVKALSTAPIMRYVLSDMGNPVFMDSQKKFENNADWELEALQWKNFLAEGGRTHTYCSQIAANLANKLGLTLFGFDLLLIPKHFCSDDTTPLDVSTVSEEESLITMSSYNSSLFDETSGAPTQLLCSAVPVLVDVNYFPGFAGVEKVGERLLELIKSKVMETPLLLEATRYER